MPGETQDQCILVIEDDQALSGMLKTYFTMQGYEVLTSAWGQQGVEQAREKKPSLILLDVRLPDINGFEVCERLQASHITRSIPVIFLTERSDRVDKLRGLGLGVIDYITKPFDIQEVRLRVRNTLRRVQELTEDNPITTLPEGESVIAHLEQWGKTTPFVTLALTGLEAFREQYGFVASDDVLRVTALTVRIAVEELAGDEGFIGHLTDHMLVVTLPADKIDPLLTLIDKRLGQFLDHFYPPDNRGESKSPDERLALQLSVATADASNLSQSMNKQVKNEYTA